METARSPLPQKNQGTIHTGYGLGAKVRKTRLAGHPPAFARQKTVPLGKAPAAILPW